MVGQAIQYLLRQRRVYSSNKRISEYEFKVEEVQQLIPLVLGEREIEVLHRVINGNSMRAIGKHMKLFSTTIIRFEQGE